MLEPHRFYYLHNFRRALDWITQRYADLLSAEEFQFLQGFDALPQPAQALLVRMLMRRGPWFRASRLVYEEIPELDAAAAPLLALGWLDGDAPMAVDELFALHTKAELQPLLVELGLPAAARKGDALRAAQQAWSETRPHAQWLPATGESEREGVWRITVARLCERFRLMFFGNLHQDWSEFVLADLGIFRYESVDFDAASRAFQSRDDVERYLALHACRQAVAEGGDAEALLQTLAACESGNAWLEKRRAKILLRLGQACERAQDWQQAQRVYALCAYPGSRHRRIRVHERLAQFEQALALAREAGEAPESEEESQRIARMLPRLQRQAGLPRTDAAPTAATTIEREECELLRPEGLPVEFALAAHLRTPGASVHYVENALINSLFGLLCWPAIFAPLPGAFFHPFQRGPADLAAPDFAQRRAPWLNASLAELDTDAWRETILRRYADKAGIQSPFVFWGTLTEELLREALHCIPAAHLKLFFTRLLRDVQANRTGLPDLVRLWPGERRYELIEVKGPGDKLQDNQIRWLRYCAAHGLPVRVCHVRWSEAPS